MKTQNTDIKQLLEIQKESSLLKSSLSLLHWDQETYMPSDGLDWRAQQISQLSGLIHDRDSSDEIGCILSNQKCSKENPSGEGESLLEKALLAKTYREYHQTICFPRNYVVEKSQCLSQSHAAWQEARSKDDFPLYQPWLEKIMDYMKQDAEYLGYDQEPYDALLDLYEPGMTTTQLKNLFDPMAKELSLLVDKISKADKKEYPFLNQTIPVDIQRELGHQILSDMGYPLSKGRLDISAHPFTIELGPKDVRITTAYKENAFDFSLYGTIHEGGHGLYELGMDKEIQGTLLGTGVSLGIHESQSRYWENLIGRSKAFCDYTLAKLRKLMPEPFANISEEDYFKGINQVKPGLIRIESDEVCYSLHIILRFNLELALLRGELKVSELPEAWREESRRLLGVVPEKDSQGVLQDIHWSGGSVGYFPTYALGNLYGAQFFHVMNQDLPQWRDKVRQGDMESILEWLKGQVHRHGSVCSPGDICRNISGESLNPRYFLNYLKDKFESMYQIS